MFPMQHVVFIVPERPVAVAEPSPGVRAALGKRLFDVVFALIILPLVAPFVAFLWLIVRRDGGAGFFAHTRVGQNGKLFKCWKLRTMAQDAEDRLCAHLQADPKAALEWRENFKLQDDPRVTRFGRFLRRTSLDELPQIWNVLRGEMSFVGPRPVVSAELEKYDSQLWAYLAMKPGITGVWQVSGRNDIAYRDRVQMDVDYLSAASRLYDAWIIFRTLGAVFRRTGY
jgi:lipopolysaccharide/colanic/teichoic acid biosynthesis glycosyltransferase